MTKDEITKELRERTGDWELLSQEAAQLIEQQEARLKELVRAMDLIVKRIPRTELDSWGVLETIDAAMKGELK